VTQRTHVLDASALLAVIHNEPGANSAAPLLKTSEMSAVNWSEVSQKVVAVGEDIDELRGDMEGLGLAVVPFGQEDAEDAARLWPVTRAAGLSLGDRACLALARRRGLIAVTADRSWKRLADAVDAQIEVIR